MTHYIGPADAISASGDYPGLARHHDPPRSGRRRERPARRRRARREARPAPGSRPRSCAGRRA